jgi:hypothetical protein
LPWLLLLLLLLLLVGRMGVRMAVAPMHWVPLMQMVLS